MSISDVFTNLMKILSAASVEVSVKVSVFQVSVLTLKTSDKFFIILLSSLILNFFKTLAVKNQFKSLEFYSLISVENENFTFNFDEITFTNLFLMILESKNFICSVL